MPPINGGAADRDDYADTVITVYNGAERTMPDHRQAAREGAAASRRSTADDPSQTADIVVIVGNVTPKA